MKKMKILIVGKGVSNDGCSKFCDELHVDYDYIDVNENVNSDYGIVIKGPGISYDNEIIKKYTKLNKMIITDVEFVYWFLNRYYIGVTGSNGKTTTTSLITNILQKKYNTIACGNIGYSMGLAAVNDKICSHFVCELSSFELKGTKYFHPKIAIITNINCCHLDYHKTFDDYLLSKKQVLINQTEEDHLIYNLDCENTISIIDESIANKYSFSLKEEAYCYIKDNYIILDNKKFIKLNRLNEKNTHTLGNYLASIIASTILNVNKKDIINSVINFEKQEYRFEYIKKNIINDAKSTNVYSTISAIKSIDKPIILLCGGLYRNYELNQLDNYLDNVKLVVCYAESKELLYEYFNSKNITCFKCSDLEESVSHCIKYLNNKNVLLYSPMFASYDMFSSYKQRGELFNKLIK